jgi:hypothetical protein
MTLGFEKPLYILPFDHRGSFQTARDAAVAEIARRYREWVDIFEKARSSP